MAHALSVINFIIPIQTILHVFKIDVIILHKSLREMELVRVVQNIPILKVTGKNVFRINVILR